MNDESNEHIAPSVIAAIEVDKLFGHYSYRLKPKDPDVYHQLLLLYGDNGSGKTTVSQLLYHALSREDGRGHRTFLAQTKFQRFTIRFTNGAFLSVERAVGQYEGPFALIGRDESGLEARVEVETSDDGSVKAKNLSQDELVVVLDKCFPKRQSVYYLSDNRILQSDEFDDESPDEWVSHHGRVITRHFGDSSERMMTPSRTRHLSVGPSVWRAETWLRRQAINASNEGEVTTSNIYTEIVGRIAKTQTEVSGDSQHRLDGVVERLASLADRTKDFSSFGLTQPVALDSLTKHLPLEDPQKQELIASVLEPYVNSVQSRLDAFGTLQKRLNIFLKIMNSFYKRKRVEITVSKGIQVFDSNDELLEMELLSSGEKQLMLLLCNILCATTQPSIFIIDEPELSLNVKWQRELVDSLLDLCAGSHVQFIMATHSIELLSQHRDAVLKLKDIGVD